MPFIIGSHFSLENQSQDEDHQRQGNSLIIRPYNILVWSLSPTGQILPLGKKSMKYSKILNKN